MKAYKKEVVAYIIELSEEEVEMFFKRMEEPDTTNHSYSILGKIWGELRGLKGTGGAV